jgi:hypothetical protein
MLKLLIIHAHFGFNQIYSYWETVFFHIPIWSHVKTLSYVKNDKSSDINFKSYAQNIEYDIDNVVR